MPRTSSDVFKRISTMESQIVDKDFIGLTYGNSGVGKTTLTMAIAQELREGGRILFVDSSDGFVTLEDFPFLMEDTDRIRVDDYRDLPVLGDALLERKKGYEEYTVVVLDEVSSWFLDMLHAFVREAEGLMPSAPLPEIVGKHYGPPSHALLDIVNKFHKTEGLHLLMVSHEQTRGREGAETAGPSLPPMFLRQINQRMHLVARVEGVIRADGYVRSVQTQPSRRVVAKSRISLLDVMEQVEDVPGKISAWAGSAQQTEDLSKPQGRTELLDQEEIEIAEDAIEVE